MSIPNGYKEEIYKESVPLMRRRALWFCLYHFLSCMWIFIHLVHIALILAQHNTNHNGESCAFWVMYIPVSIAFYCFSSWIFYKRQVRWEKYLLICSISLLDIILFFFGPVDRNTYIKGLTSWPFWSGFAIIVGKIIVLLGFLVFLIPIRRIIETKNPIDRQEPL